MVDHKQQSAREAGYNDEVKGEKRGTYYRSEHLLETDLTKINSIIDGYQYRKRFLLSILLDIQEEYEYISRNALICVSERLNIPLIRVYGVASLYKALKLESGIKASIGIEGQESLKEDYLWKFR